MAERVPSAAAARALGRDHAGLSGAARFAPLIDVVFLLLLYFLLATQFRHDERPLRVGLPDASGAARAEDPFALPQRPVTIFVRSGAAGAVIRTDSPLLPDAPTPEALRAALEDARGLDLGAEQRFLISAAPDAKWEHTLEALNAALRAGYEHVRLGEGTP